ncbi:MAG: glutamate--tRNA ligase family protein [Sulfurovum sp.]|nr:glutamate--tRNA ligase family protein [Sulfurovum sp.]
MLRFTTTPTGDMHIGTLRVAIMNYLLAQQRKESFTIRIDDIDKSSNIEGKDTEIMQILEKFALNHESVFHQSEHLHMHQTLAIRLLEEGKAFVCTCTIKQHETDPYSGRCFNVDKTEHAKLKEGSVPFVIRIKGELTSTAEEVDSFVILNVDGTPTQNFACACDDMISGVDFILREEEQHFNTAKQIHIKKQLGFEQETIYAHLPHLTNTLGEKMLQEEDTSLVKWLFGEGFIPDAIINYLLLLGNSEAEKEIFTLPEAIQWFKLENISKSEAVFDIDRLRSINAEHLRRMDDRQLSTLFGFADPDIGKLAKIYLEEVSTIKELIAKIKPIFAAKDFDGVWGTQMRKMETLVQNAPMINDFDTFESYMLKESGLKGEDFSIPLKLLLTGAQNGPKLADIYPLIKPYLLEVAS